MSDDDGADHEEDADEGGENENGSRKRGRTISPVWAMFTDNALPWKLKTTICKHCHSTVNTEKKSEYAERHLKNALPMWKTVARKQTQYCQPSSRFPSSPFNSKLKSSVFHT